MIDQFKRSQEIQKIIEESNKDPKSISESLDTLSYLLKNHGKMSNIIHEVVVKFTKSVLQWGTDFDDKNTVNDWVTYITMYATDAVKMNRETKELDVEKFKDGMKTVAGLAVAALLAADRLDGKLALRHYDEGYKNESS